jgi:ribosome-associated protein
MKFKEWLNETMTSTGDIASFLRISIPMVRRQWPPSIATMFYNDPPDEKKKKKPKMQPQVQENTEIDPLQVIMPEIELAFVRSQGAGGQNVNKLNTKAVLKWDVYNSQIWTDPDAFARFVNMFKNRISGDNKLVLTSQETRSQLQNKNNVLDKLRVMIQRAMTPPVKRRPTKPTFAAHQKRLNQKTIHSRNKARRRDNKVI